MGGLIKTFTFGRNALKATVEGSSDSVIRSFEFVRAGTNLRELKSSDNGRYNVIRDLISFTGALKRTDDIGEVTPVGEAFERLKSQDSRDAWRWLLTRSLWLYTVPNGTRSDVNSAAQGGEKFDFFRRVLGLTLHLSALPASERYLSFEEICILFDDDDVWRLEPAAVFDRLRQLRTERPEARSSSRSFLADLETEYSIPRDNFAALFGKAFSQTGLFTYRSEGRRTTAIALRDDLDEVLQRRVRFILDNPAIWSADSWDEHLAIRDRNDLPEEISHVEQKRETILEEDIEIKDLPASFLADLGSVGITYSEEFIRRFVSATIAKRFVILTGLSGSGKTKLAQSFAKWISPLSNRTRWHATLGETIQADRVSYVVLAADALSIEIENSDGGSRVSLPYALVREWIDAIQEHGYDKSVSSRVIRESVVPVSAYSPQINSFEAHLKSLAFHIIERETEQVGAQHYELVAVGPEWTSKETSLGYADALLKGSFVRSTPIIDLILRATADPTAPYFLILDEMNLAHVERYFSDFISSLESDEPISLHSSSQPLDGVPQRLVWPQNLIVIGTVNVDDTTYPFSPKVLDRSNCLEFRVEETNLVEFWTAEKQDDLQAIESRGIGYSKNYTTASVSSLPVSHLRPKLRSEMLLLFRLLSSFNLEFGFRTAAEVDRFCNAYSLFDTSEHALRRIVDAQVYQKILPRLNGAKRKIEPILCSLSIYCTTKREWDSDTDSIGNSDSILEAALKASRLDDQSSHPLFAPPDDYVDLELSQKKIIRMLRKLDAEGFVSFAEA